MKKILFLALIASIATSCATHTGMISSSSFNQPVKYIDVAIGTSETVKCFGIGGLSKDAIVLDAKNDMNRNRPLKGNEIYANYTVNIKNSLIFFYSKTKVTVSADVVSNTKDTTNSPYTELYKSKLVLTKYTNELFSIGDTIYYNLMAHSGTILSYVSSTKVKIKCISTNNTFTTKIIHISNIFTKKATYKGIKVGDKYMDVVPNENHTGGIVSAFGTNSIIIKDGAGFYEKKHNDMRNFKIN